MKFRLDLFPCFFANVFSFTLYKLSDLPFRYEIFVSDGIEFVNFNGLRRLRVANRSNKLFNLVVAFLEVPFELFPFIASASPVTSVGFFSLVYRSRCFTFRTCRFLRRDLSLLANFGGLLFLNSLHVFDIIHYLPLG